MLFCKQLYFNNAIEKYVEVLSKHIGAFYLDFNCATTFFTPVKFKKKWIKVYILGNVGFFQGQSVQSFLIFSKTDLKRIKQIKKHCGCFACFYKNNLSKKNK